MWKNCYLISISFVVSVKPPAFILQKYTPDETAAASQNLRGWLHEQGAIPDGQPDSDHARSITNNLWNTVKGCKDNGDSQETEKT